MRYGRTIEYFNSFGLFPSDKDFVDDDQLNDELDQEHLFLNKLLDKEIDEEQFDDILYNKVKFQRPSETVNTCGRHVLNRLICMIHFNMHLQDYIDFMKKIKKETKMNYDELVASIII